MRLIHENLHSQLADMGIVIAIELIFFFLILINKSRRLWPLAYKEFKVKKF